MEIKLTLALPRDAASVPVVRKILTSSLQTIGVREETIYDIELALTEACTNVLDHAHGTEDYEVAAGIDGRTCVIEVIDRGGGFDAAGLAEPGPYAEDGRGLLIMKALVDEISFINRPEDGTVVHMEKRLTWDDDALITRLDTKSGGWADR